MRPQRQPRPRQRLPRRQRKPRRKTRRHELTGRACDARAACRPPRRPRPTSPRQRGGSALETHPEPRERTVQTPGGLGRHLHGRGAVPGGTKAPRAALPAKCARGTRVGGEASEGTSRAAARKQRAKPAASVAPDTQRREQERRGGKRREPPWERIPWFETRDKRSPASALCNPTPPLPSPSSLFFSRPARPTFIAARNRRARLPLRPRSPTPTPAFPPRRGAPETGDRDHAHRLQSHGRCSEPKRHRVS